MVIHHIPSVILPLNYPSNINHTKNTRMNKNLNPHSKDMRNRHKRKNDNDFFSLSLSHSLISTFAPMSTNLLIKAFNGRLTSGIFLEHDTITRRMFNRVSEKEMENCQQFVNRDNMPTLTFFFPLELLLFFSKKFKRRDSDFYDNEHCSDREWSFN